MSESVRSRLLALLKETVAQMDAVGIPKEEERWAWVPNELLLGIEKSELTVPVSTKEDGTVVFPLGRVAVVNGVAIYTSPPWKQKQEKGRYQGMCVEELRQVLKRLPGDYLVVLVKDAELNAVRTLHYAEPGLMDHGDVWSDSELTCQEIRAEQARSGGTPCVLLVPRH